jgi:MarR family transcriptional regulator, transcriptional regulator for hemolysin
MSHPKALPTNNPNRTFGYVLKDTAKLYVQRFEERARELGLTLPQCKALVYLARSEGISQVELASSAEIDPMSIVRILDRMELDGWVERRADPNDRRARRLYLQPKAKPLLEAIDRVSLTTRDEALAGFTDQEAETLFDALDRVRHNIAALQPLPEFPGAPQKKAVRIRTAE